MIRTAAVALAILLAACGSKSKPAAEPAGETRNTALTCSPVRQQEERFGLGAYSDYRERCVYDNWSQEVIDCFAAAPTETAAQACVPGEVASTEPAEPTPPTSALCTRIEAILEAGASSPPFESIKGSPLDADDPRFKKRSDTWHLSLPDADDCVIREYEKHRVPTTVTCDTVLASSDEAKVAYAALVEQAATCALPPTWHQRNDPDKTSETTWSDPNAYGAFMTIETAGVVMDPNVVQLTVYSTEP